MHHVNHIIHRDIKPANVLVHYLQDDSVIYKICDFGGAKALDKTNSMAITTVGTPFYISPEIMTGKPYTNKVDIWSFGVFMYYLFELKYPWMATSWNMLA